MSKSLVLTAWIAAVAALSAASLTPSFAPPSAYRSDLLIHFGVYLVLAAMPAALLESRRLGLVLGGLLALVGAALEVAQLYVPGRSGSLLDLAADWVGIALGLALGATANRLLARHLPGLVPELRETKRSRRRG